MSSKDRQPPDEIPSVSSTGFNLRQGSHNTGLGASFVPGHHSEGLIFEKPRPLPTIEKGAVKRSLETPANFAQFIEKYTADQKARDKEISQLITAVGQTNEKIGQISQQLHELKQMIAMQSAGSSKISTSGPNKGLHFTTSRPW